MRFNWKLVQVSQFLQQFKLDVYHKLSKKHTIFDTLSCLTSANTPFNELQHSELNTLFIYNIIPVEIHPILVSQILVDYKANP